MNVFNRRIFVKTLLATAASAAPAHSALHKGIFSRSFAAEDASANIEAGNQQLRISPEGAALAFQNFLRIDGEWKPATLANNPFVVGDSFSLVTSRLRHDGSLFVVPGRARR